MSNTYCVVFLFCLSSSCVPYVTSFSGLSMSVCCKVYSGSNQSIHIGNLMLAMYYVNVKDC